MTCCEIASALIDADENFECNCLESLSMPKTGP
jgi:hypothetical protein